MKKLILALFVFLFFQPLYSQEWRRIGLEGRAVLSLETDPVDKNTLYAGCAYSGNAPGLYRSPDGGFTWEHIFQKDEAVHDIDFDSQKPNTLYICAKRIWKSVDKGETWFITDSGIENISDMSRLTNLVIHPNYSEKILVTHYYDFFAPKTDIYKSNNAGGGWEKRDSTKSVSAMEQDQYNENTLYMGDEKTSAVYKTEDFGENWFLWKPYISFGGGELRLYAIKVVSIDSVIVHTFAIGGSGFNISRDSGISWNVENRGLPNGSIINHITSSDSMFFVAIVTFPGWVADVYKSHLHDINWELVGNEQSFSKPIRTLHYSPVLKKLFAGTDDGLFFYDFSTYVSKREKQNPNKFRLKQNYPNPFNNSTTIEFEINKPINVKLDLYDVNGKWLKNLLSESKNPGIYKTTLSLNEHASGVYFYKLKGGDYEKVKKLLLIR